MKKITNIKEIIEETVINENNDKLKFLTSFRTNEKIYTDYGWEGEKRFVGTENTSMITYLDKVDRDNKKRKESYFNEVMGNQQHNRIIIISQKNKEIEAYIKRDGKCLKITGTYSEECEQNSYGGLRPPFPKRCVCENKSIDMSSGEFK